MRMHRQDGGYVPIGDFEKGGQWICSGPPFLKIGEGNVFLFRLLLHPLSLRGFHRGFQKGFHFQNESCDCIKYLNLGDPCCGSGGMFVQSAKFVENHSGNINNIAIYGQDSNPTTWKMAQMNLAIRGIEPDLGAYAADTFLDDRHPTMRADFIMANPPFNEDCCIGRGLGAIRSKDGHQSFVLYTMFALREQLNVFNGEGTVFGSINRDALNSMPVDIPPKEIMDQFENIVAPMDVAIRNNYDEICCLQAMRDSLLPRLMSGELDVSGIEL